MQQIGLTDAQLAKRRGGISASEIAVLAGYSKWSSPLALYLDKRGELERGENSVPADFGLIIEDGVGQLYAHRRRRHLTKVDTLQSERHPLAFATPDRAVFVERPGWFNDSPTCHNVALLREAERLCQIKSTSWRLAHEWGAPGTDEVPDDYLCQVTWEMGVTGVPLCDFAVLFDKDRFEVYTVAFSRELFEGLYEIAGRFWTDHVLKGVPPPPDATKRYGELIGKAFPSPKTKDLKAPTPDLEKTIHQWAMIKEAQGILDKAQKFLRSKICHFIAEDEGVAGPFGTITWKKTKDSKKLDTAKAYEDAHLLASLLLSRLAPHLEADELEGLKKRLNSIPVEHLKTTPGYRKLHKKLSDGYMPASLPPLELEATRALIAGVAGDDTSTEE